MASLNNEDINHVRESANISEIISQYIPIEKKGKNFVSICPFHEDTNPSMTISEEKQIYKCFVCGAGGNVFTFVSKYNNISFVEAVGEVAKFINIPLDIPKTGPVVQVNQEHAPYHKMMEDATNYLHFKLINSQEDLINRYVKDRDLTASDLEYFNVGYESDHSLVEFMEKKGYKRDSLKKINLINEGDYGVRSVFNNRLLFPIHNSNAQVVGYSGRAIINDSNTAKYINSNENIIYTKGDVLYNYHRAKDIAKKESSIYLVEGVMDVIGFYKANVLNCVATLGTALTENQVKLLRSLSPNIVLSYDGDSAGQLATVKAIDLLLKHNFTIEVLSGFKDLDPDDYLKKNGKEAFNSAILERIGVMDYLILYYKQKYNLDNFEERKEFTITLSKYLDDINSDFDRTYFVNQISSLTNFSKDQILQLKIPSSKEKVFTKPIKKRIGLSSQRPEYSLIGQMISGKSAAYYIRDNIGFLPDQNLYQIYLIIIEYYHQFDELVEADLLTMINLVDDTLAQEFLEILNNDMIIKEFDAKIIDENITLIESKLIDNEIRRLSSLQEFDENKKTEILIEIAELKRKKAEKLQR